MLCRVIYPQAPELESDYVIQATLNNKSPMSSAIGIIFNAASIDTFEFVYVS